MSSVTDIRKYFRIGNALSNKLYICLFCGHKTFGYRCVWRMAVHKIGRHLKSDIKFEWDFEGFGKVYDSLNSLKYHRIDHLWGFSSNENLNRFCEKVSI